MGELGRARVRASLFGERERERSRNVEGIASSVSGRGSEEEVRGASLRGSLLTVGLGLGWLSEVWRDE